MSWQVLTMDYNILVEAVLFVHKTKLGDRVVVSSSMGFL